MDAATSSGTNQELTLDHSSFEKLLAAAWVLQCLNDQLHPAVDGGRAIAAPVVAPRKIETASSQKQEIVKPGIIKPSITQPTFQTSRFVMDNKPQLSGAGSADARAATELVKTQEAISTGMLELEATVKRLVSLSPKLTQEPAAHQPVVQKPEPVKLTPIEPPIKAKSATLPQPTPPLQPTLEGTPVRQSPIRQKASDRNRSATRAWAFDLGVSLNRLRGVLVRNASAQRANSTLGVRAVGAAAHANLRTIFSSFQDAVTRYRAVSQVQTEKEPALHGSTFKLDNALKRLRDACTPRPATFRISLNLRSLRAVAIATPVWLLVVIASLLLLETWLHQPFQDARAMSAPGSSTVQAAVSVNAPAHSTLPLSQPAKRTASTELRQPVPPFADSHDQITDSATSSVVAQLSRFEISGLRRQAKYGDDSAAFTLGMVYEVGRFVRQNCKEAARWVTRAAEAGNPAAEYNLGLRYRDGDGVSADLHESEKWLRKAAAHRNRNAKLALQLLASR
jgi:hypothetical protein